MTINTHKWSTVKNNKLSKAQQKDVEKRVKKELFNIDEEDYLEQFPEVRKNIKNTEKKLSVIRVKSMIGITIFGIPLLLLNIILSSGIFELDEGIIKISIILSWVLFLVGSSLITNRIYNKDK